LPWTRGLRNSSSAAQPSPEHRSVLPNPNT
jgi:hypothetical protein